jgi:hypothetical protein
MHTVSVAEILALRRTLVIAPGGKVPYRKTGGIDPLEVRGAIVDDLGRTY